MRRGRFKRMMREVFRTERAGLPSDAHGCYDIVLTARPHADAGLETYREWVLGAIDAAHRVHQKRARKGEGDA